MKATPILLLASLLAFPTGSAFADAGPPPSPPRAPQLRPDASPTAQAHLDVAQTAVKTALAALARATTVPHGGYVEKAMVEVNKTADDLTQATAYVKAHPEANALANGPAPAETAPAKFTVAPPTARGARAGGGGAAQTNMLTALDALNAALNEFMNPVGSSYHGPIMGDLGGFRQTIMADISQANADVLGGINYANGSGVPAVPAPASTSAPTPKPTADTEDDHGNDPRLPSAIVGLALSAALSLGGLHVFSRKKLANK
jgi:hypothetical protein